MRSRIVQELTQEYKYQVYEDHTEGAMQTLLALLLYHEHLERQEQTASYRKKHIQKMFYGVKALLSMPGICGREIGTEEVVKFMESEYGIDFQEVKINKETKYQFMKNGKYR